MLCYPYVLSATTILLVVPFLSWVFLPRVLLQSHCGIPIVQLPIRGPGHISEEYGPVPSYIDVLLWVGILQHELLGVFFGLMYILVDTALSWDRLLFGPNISGWLLLWKDQHLVIDHLDILCFLHYVVEIGDRVLRSIFRALQSPRMWTLGRVGAIYRFFLLRPVCLPNISKLSGLWKI